jgi:histidine triad (HIT) family protein
MADEIRAAQLAKLQQIQDGAGPTIFDKILQKQIPSECVHEDDLCYAFKDINPQAPVHILVIPKVRAGLTQIRNATSEHAEVLGHLMVKSGELGRTHAPEGFRLVVNDGEQGAQSVRTPLRKVDAYGKSICAWFERTATGVPLAHPCSRRQADAVAARLKTQATVSPHVGVAGVQVQVSRTTTEGGSQKVQQKHMTG